MSPHPALIWIDNALRSLHEWFHDGIYGHGWRFRRD